MRIITGFVNLGINANWLLTGDGSMHIGEVQKESNIVEAVEVVEFNEDFALIPNYHVSVSAGYGSLNNDDPSKHHLAFRRSWLRSRNLNPKDLVVVFASGDSMEPTINNGNTILVDMSDTLLKDGSIYVLRFGEHLYAKRLQQRFDGSVCLKSDNKEYDDQIVRKDELEQLAIIGKVVWIGKDLH